MCNRGLYMNKSLTYNENPMKSSEIGMDDVCVIGVKV